MCHRYHRRRPGTGRSCVLTVDYPTLLRSNRGTGQIDSTLPVPLIWSKRTKAIVVLIKRQFCWLNQLLVVTPRNLPCEAEQGRLHEHVFCLRIHHRPHRVYHGEVVLCTTGPRTEFWGSSKIFLPDMTCTKVITPRKSLLPPSRFMRPARHYLVSQYSLPSLYLSIELLVGY